MIDIYRDALLMVIEEIHQNLQIMDIKELLTSETLAPFENSGHSYDKEKLMVYLHDRDSDYTSRVLGRMGLQNMVEKGELPEIALEFDGDELLIFLNAWQWSINEKD